VGHLWSGHDGVAHLARDGVADAVDEPGLLDCLCRRPRDGRWQCAIPQHETTASESHNARSKPCFEVGEEIFPLPNIPKEVRG
jgi:hypothetical protein